MAATIINAKEARALGVSTERLRHLDKFMQQITDDGTHPAGVIRVLRRGTEIFSGAYGVKAPGGPPTTTDTIFPLSSVTKPVTATLLAILQEDGVIDFCDRLSRYFPEFTGDKKDAVEIWQLLCHSSGMSDEIMGSCVDDFVKQRLGKESLEGVSSEQYYQTLLEARESLGLPKAAPGEERKAVGETERILRLRAPLATDPHTAFDYCSTAYSLLGELIEKLTGESVDSFAQRRLFGPLGMTDTYFNLPKEKWPRVVKRDPAIFMGEWLNSEDTLTNTSGAGGLKSTMYDLTRLGQMYLQKGELDGSEVLSPASVRMLSTDYNADLPVSSWFGRMLSSAWTLGWVISDGKKDDLGLLRSVKTLDHGGAGGARLIIDPDSDLVFAMYLVDKERFQSYCNHSRIANIIYSALR